MSTVLSGAVRSGNSMGTWAVVRYGKGRGAELTPYRGRN